MDGLITMAHGAGGKKTAELINNIFKKYLINPLFTGDDAAVLPVSDKRLAFSTDGFIVSPPEFPGGNIGKLSICGTVNDLACMGAIPRYLACAFVIEEGMLLAELERYVASMAETAAEAGIHIVAGDTKVSGKGKVDKLFITTTGIGEIRDEAHTSGTLAKPGDKIIVSGDVGRHGCAILLARDTFGIDADVTSDCAPLNRTIDLLYDVTDDIHVIRDATRGGVGTVLYEICEQSGVGIRLDMEAVPVSPTVQGVCGMLGLEPLYLACEGRLVIIVPAADADGIIKILRQGPYSQNAAVIGEVTAADKGFVKMTTEIGTQTVLPPPSGELLPRIC